MFLQDRGAEQDKDTGSLGVYYLVYDADVCASLWQDKVKEAIANIKATHVIFG